MPELESRLRTIFEQRKVKTMFIVGDGSLRYGDIVAVIDAAKGAGVEKVGIITEGMRKAAQAGANLAVAGSAVFNQTRAIRENIKQLKDLS